MQDRGRLGVVLVAPALAAVLVLFVYPLGYSLVTAFQAKGGGFTLANFGKAFEFYSVDIVFTLVIIGVSTLLIALASIAIGGYLTLGENPRAVAVLRWLYRWPLFIPFVVAAQCMRTFLAKNGLMNNTLVSLGILEVDQTIGFLDWRGIIITFVWKQTPFVALLVAGAMASLDRSTIEAARNLGAGRLRILFEILVPQVMPTLAVGLILSFVTMMSVLSVPLMISGESPTMMTVDMAFRINNYGDYGTANALGFISYLMTATCAWFYLKKKDPMTTWIGRGIVFGLLAFVVLGPLANLVLWAAAEQWYFPHKLPLVYGTKFWEQVFKPRGDALTSLVTSVWIALATVAASLALAVPAGYALARLKLPWRTAILLAFLLPQAFPSLAVYINIARLFYDFRLNGTMTGVIMVHTVHGLVFAVWITAAAFAAVDRDLELAARNLGASGVRTFLTVSLPLAAPGIMASAIFVFLESLDEFTGTFFVGVPDVITLPLLMFTASIAGNYQIAAITALILLVPSVVFMLVIERFLKADVLAKVGA